MALFALVAKSRHLRVLSSAVWERLMKLRKALKRLDKVEATLSNILSGLPTKADGLGDLLTSARDNVVRAQKTVHSQLSNSAERKPPGRATQARRLSAEGRKRISLAAKKRWAAAKRKGINAVTGQRLK